MPETKLKADRSPGALERLGSHAKLTQLEQAVLGAIDGQRTVREIVESTKMSSFEACKVIYQFLNSRVVRRKAPSLQPGVRMPG